MKKVCVVLCGVSSMAYALEYRPGPGQHFDERLRMGTPMGAGGTPWQPNEQEREEVIHVAQARHTNWYLKNKLYKEAHKVYEAIQEQAARVPGAKAGLLKQRGKADDLVKSFFHEVPYEEAQVTKVLSPLAAELEKERKSMVELTEEERATLRALASKKTEIEQVVAEVKQLHELDHSIDTVLEASLEQIRAVKTYKERALQDLEAIARTLSDVQAQQLLADMRTQEKNIASSSTYLTDEVPRFFTEAMMQLKERMQRIQARLEALKKQGVALSKQVDEELAADARRKEQEHAVELTKPAQKAPLDWGTWAQQKMAAVGSWVSSFFSSKKAD